jgi:hypothetical protein
MFSFKRLFGALLLVALGWGGGRAQSTPAEGLARLDSVRGLGALRLHAQLEALSLRWPLVRAGAFQRTQRYRISSDTLRLEGIAIDRAVLYFYQRRLHSFELTVRGQANAEVLRLVLEGHYGHGAREGYAERWLWRGERVVLSLEQNLLTRDATVRFESIALQQAIERGYLRELEGGE